MLYTKNFKHIKLPFLIDKHITIIANVIKLSTLDFINKQPVYLGHKYNIKYCIKPYFSQANVFSITFLVRVCILGGFLFYHINQTSNKLSFLVQQGSKSQAINSVVGKLLY
jgi:hypothetical protein